VSFAAMLGGLTCQQEPPMVSRSRFAVGADAAAQDIMFDLTKDLARAPEIDLAAPIPDHAQLESGVQEAGKDLSVGCGRITVEGCCDGEALFWCEGGELHHLNCADRPSCGWSAAGFFDCDTTGISDPQGNFSRDCSRLKTEAGVPELSKLDARLADGKTDPCHGVSKEGCCQGNILRYCKQGTLETLDCALNAACGWNANGTIYDCGNEGLPDPSGKWPMACPAGLPDAGLLPHPDQGSPTPEASVDLGGDGLHNNDGCSCALEPSGHAEDAVWVVLLLLVVGGVFRRRGD
jgi:MYXO-CTERM domain-containing protein